MLKPIVVILVLGLALFSSAATGTESNYGSFREMADYVNARLAHDPDRMRAFLDAYPDSKMRVRMLKALARAAHFERHEAEPPQRFDDEAPESLSDEDLVELLSTTPSGAVSYEEFDPGDLY